MTKALLTFLENHQSRYQPLFRAAMQAYWQAATTGQAEDTNRVAESQAEIMRLFADPTSYEQLKNWRETLQVDDPLLDRQLTRLYLAYADGQQDPANIDRIAELEKQVLEVFTNFRAAVSGQDMTDNELDQLLLTSTQSEEVRTAWMASKEIGHLVESQVRELARLRNAAAKKLGFPNYFTKSLELSEIGETRLFAILDNLAAITDEPFRQAKARLDEYLSQRFGVRSEDLQPWYYGNKFFQTPPQMYTPDLDTLFAGQDMVALGVRTYEGLGMDVHDIMARSDLYARPGKDQHAFAIDIDRQGDIRILCNLEPNLRWADTLLHELGHAVYDQYIDPDLPFLLHQPPHGLSTEAIALLMGRLSLQSEWLKEILGAPADQVDRLAPAVRAQQQLRMLTFVRWVLVVVHFERALYRDPDADLNQTWWDLVERFQFLRRPEGRTAPDWASKIHIALYPVYYQNYLLGELMASQLRDRLEGYAGGLINRPAAGEYLIQRLFRLGDRADWDETLRRATGESLNPVHFVQEFVTP